MRCNRIVDGHLYRMSHAVATDIGDCTVNIKIDKPGIDPDRCEERIVQYGILWKSVEGWRKKPSLFCSADGCRVKSELYWQRDRLTQ